MAQHRILVIEDDEAVRHGVVHALRFHGFEAIEAADAGPARKLAFDADFDLILLDLVLPGGDGLEILRELRRRRGPVPVIILTARGDEEDRIRGLQLGADDYVVKPFSVKELIARVEAVLRRCPDTPHEPVEIEVPGGRLDPGRATLRLDDGTCHTLPEREAELLEYLASNAGRVVTREELLARVWHLNPKAVETRTVDMHIARLRDRLRDDPENPHIIVTVRGRGYIFEAEK
jgi:two-component system, OmpR family, alkaline phosphatase synthesis response regulator PhoP